MANNVSVSIDVTDNSKEFLEAMASQVAKGLEAIGGEMEKHAKEGAPVDTGRLRNSITFATETAQGQPNTDKQSRPGAVPQDAKPSDYAMLGVPDQNTVVVGTNVEYAAEQEYYGKNKHFLKNAASDYGDDYKKIMQAALQT